MTIQQRHPRAARSAQRLVEGAVRDVLHSHRPSAVLNLAAETHVDRSIDNPRAFVDTNVVGTLTLTGATLEPGADMFFDLGPTTTVGGTANDLLVVNGDLTINLNNITINPQGLLTLGSPYRIINYTGTLIANGDLTVSSPNGYTFTVDTNTPGQIKLTAAGGPPVDR